MGTVGCTYSSVMKPLVPLFGLLLILQASQGYNMARDDEIELVRRGYRDPDDPRNLFAAMYGGVYKRGDQSMPHLTPDLYQYLKEIGHKRRLNDPNDPSHLTPDLYQYLKEIGHK